MANQLLTNDVVEQFMIRFMNLSSLYILWDRLLTNDVIN